MSVLSTVIFLGQTQYWLRISDGEIVERGEGFPSAHEAMRIVGVVPASDVVVHQLALPALTDAQARAAARLAVASNSVSPISTLHVAVGAEIEGERTVVVLSADRMTQYLVQFAERGLDADAIVAAPLILSRPELGFFVADLGPEIVIRGQDGAFLDDPVLTPLLTGGEVHTLDRDAVDAAIVAAAAAPEVDLRQGVFARRRRWRVDVARWRRIGWLAAACLSSLLILPIAGLIHLNIAVRNIAANDVEMAERVLPPGTVVTDPLAQLDERLGSLGGAGGGFLVLANAVASAAQASANVELGAMTFDSVTGLHVSAHSVGLPELVALETRMAAMGLVVTPMPTTGSVDRPTRDFTVRAR